MLGIKIEDIFKNMWASVYSYHFLLSGYFEFPTDLKETEAIYPM